MPIDALLSYIAPHYCYGCGATGSLLCRSCLEAVKRSRHQVCVICGQPCANGNACRRHALPYRALDCVLWRRGAVARLIDDYKFHRVRAASGVLAGLLDELLPEYDVSTVVVPVPTAPANIRKRGYDHMLLVARQFARRRGLRVERPLVRQTNVTQHYARSAAERRKQAQQFFRARGARADVPYLILDDIFTTGSTITAAAQTLRAAGARDIRVGIIARHGNDKKAAAKTPPNPSRDDTNCRERSLGRGTAARRE
ncbi:ComF family protein [Candidatus Saccharibacteria bacterium oral taxon 488]|nr:ComF family protein [Candidatus Saccharibacteria bacterium oral taxon 488]